MKSIQVEDLSLHHYIKDCILSDFTEIESTTLSYLEDQSTTGSYVYAADSTITPSPIGIGRGWKYIDSWTDTTEQQNSVTIYDELGTVISGSNYLIDYIDGRIIFSNQSIIPYSVTYKWNYVSVVDEWQLVESSDVPIVVVDISGFFKEGFQIGAGKKVPRTVTLHIFASDTSERDAIMETLYDGLYLKSCPNQSFPKGTLLDWNGTFNTKYEYSVIDNSSSLKFDNISAKAMSIPLLSIPNRDVTQLSDTNRYRARINLEMFHWNEGW
jgi:hypothetical protein